MARELQIMETAMYTLVCGKLERGQGMGCQPFSLEEYTRVCMELENGQGMVYLPISPATYI